MKLSEVNQRKADLEAIAVLRNERREVAGILAALADGSTATVGDGYSEITVSGDAMQHVRRALEQQQLDIEQELIGLGVEIDEAADAPDYDDDDRADDGSGDIEESA
jgi:hypothetical protein